MTIEEVAAHIAIQQILYRYCRGVDRGDRALLASVYHDDAIDAHGAWTGLGRDFADYLVPAMDAVPVVGQHHITNMLIDLDGDSANVESAFLALHPESRENGQPGHIFVGGRYLDRFERRAGQWKIASRTVVIDVSQVLEAGRDWAGAANFLSGARREADASASVLGADFAAPTPA